MRAHTFISFEAVAGVTSLLDSVVQRNKLWLERCLASGVW